MALPGYFWDRWPYFAGKLSWDITTTQVNSALHPSGVAKSSISFGWGKSGKVTSAGWQVCDLIWHVISRSGVVISITNCYIRFTLLYFIDNVPLNACERLKTQHRIIASVINKIMYLKNEIISVSVRKTKTDVFIANWSGMFVLEFSFLTV